MDEQKIMEDYDKMVKKEIDKNPKNAKIYDNSFMYPNEG